MTPGRFTATREGWSMAFEFQKFNALVRFTADPEPIKTVGDSSLCVFRVAFTGERKKDRQTGKWDDSPVFMTCEAWQYNGGSGTGKKLADDIASRAHKGGRAIVEGTLKMEEWEDKNGGGKRSQIKLKITEIVWLDKDEKRAPKRAESSGGGYADDDGGYGGDGGGGADPLPF